MPDGARWKSCWFCLASWTKSLQETWRKLARLHQTASEFYFVYYKRQNLVLSGSIWPASFNFPSNFWSRKPDRTNNFLSGSVWHDFCWLSGPWYSQGISWKKLKWSDSSFKLWVPLSPLALGGERNALWAGVGLFERFWAWWTSYNSACWYS